MSSSQTTHLPVLADGGGDFIAVAIDGGQAARYRTAEGALETQAPSLEEYLLLALHCYDTGVFYVDPEGNWLEQDDDGYAAAKQAFLPEATKRRGWQKPGHR